MTGKFKVERTDGRPLPETARFFCLRLDDPSKPDNRACRAALVTYIREAWELDPDAAQAAHKLLWETAKPNNDDDFSRADNFQPLEKDHAKTSNH